MTKYYIKHGEATEELVIGKSIGAGAVGTVFNVRSPLSLSDCAAKLYQEPSGFIAEKIQAMIDDSPSKIWFDFPSGSRHPQFAWPQYIVYSPNRFSQTLEPIGFLMPKVEQQAAVSLDAYFDQKLGEKKGLDPDSLSLPRRLDVSLNLCGLLAELHTKHVYCIDFKPQNILAHRINGLITFLDCDSYSVVSSAGNRYPATQFSRGYVAPEALKKGSAPSELGEAQDCFALAVCLFQIFNYGIYPYSGIIQNGWPHADNDDDRAKAGYYPYGIIPNPAIKPVAQSIHDLLPLEIRELFDRAFTESKARPSAKDWYDVLHQLKSTARFRSCDAHPGNPEHIRLENMPCSKCERDRRVKTQRDLRTSTKPTEIKINGLDSSGSSSNSAPAAPPAIPSSGTGNGAVLFVGSLVGVGILISVFSGNDKPAPTAAPPVEVPSRIAVGAPMVPSIGGDERAPFRPEEILYCLKASNRIELINSALKAKNINSPPSLQHDIADYNSRCVNYRYYEEDLTRVKANFEMNKTRLSSDVLNEIPNIIASAQYLSQPSQTNFTPSYNAPAPAPAPAVKPSLPANEGITYQRSRSDRRQPNRQDISYESPPAQRVSTVPASSYLNSIRGGNLSAVEYYIKNNSSPNDPLSNGATPLKNAVVSTQISVAEFLISQGADVNARDGSGKTALTWALQLGSKSMVSMLRQHGAVE